MNDFVDTLVAQGITPQSQKFKKFVTRQVENLSGGASSRGPAPSLNNNLTRHSTEHLEFPLNVSSADPGLGIMVTISCFISMHRRKQNLTRAVEQIVVQLQMTHHNSIIFQSL